MKGLERLFDLLAEHQLACWPDWGTLLGWRRHGNVIPWDYDADLCMFPGDYAALLEVFARHDNQIGLLKARPDYYGERHGTFAILFDGHPDDWLGIDVVAYQEFGDPVQSRMSAALIADFPDNYNFRRDVLFPFAWGHCLGHRLPLPARVEERLIECFGPDWREYPDGYVDSALTASPGRDLGAWIEAGQLLIDTDLREPAVLVPQRSLPPAGSLRAEVDAVWTWTGVEPLNIRVLLREQIERLQTVGVSREEIEQGSFTDWVFCANQSLWGQVLAGSLEPGQSVRLSEGCFARVGPTLPQPGTRIEKREHTESDYGSACQRAWLVTMEGAASTPLSETAQSSAGCPTHYAERYA